MGLRGRENLTDESLFFVTTIVVGFTKVFITNVYCDILINNIKHYQEKMFQNKLHVHDTSKGKRNHHYKLQLVQFSFGIIFPPMDSDNERLDSSAL
jgi:hypothetical protein